jgi:putative membrane protein
VLFVGLLQYFKFRNSRLFIEDDFIILQSGAWDISNKIIEPNRIQAITTSQLFWHKNINIGSLTLHTAGGNIAFQLGDFEKIQQYVNLWLYRLEKSDSNWM